MSKNKQKTVAKGRKTVQKVDETTVPNCQIDLIEGKTVGELKEEALLSKARTVIKTEAKDITLPELRESVKRSKSGNTRVAFSCDPRNHEGIQIVSESTGIKKEIICDVALDRFLSWQDKKSAKFPFEAVKDVNQGGKRTTIVISEQTKQRLDAFCVDNLQQVSVIINLALQSFVEEVNPFNK